MTTHDKSSVRTELFTRQPQHDKRIGRGDDFAGDAWLDTTSGAIVYVVVGHDLSTKVEEGDRTND